MRRIITFIIISLCINVYAQTYRGIDVSHHQGIIDWPKVHTDSAITFVYIKATTGSTGIDSCYVRNVKGARKAGIKVGSYHYLTSKSSVRTQFANFAKMARKEWQDLIPMVDVENMRGWSHDQVQDSLLVFCQLIKEHYGKAPMIYGTNRSYNTYCAPDFNKYHIMIGRYGSLPPVIKGKGHYSIWQYSEKGTVPGISRYVDLDTFHPDYSIEDFCL